MILLVLAMLLSTYPQEVNQAHPENQRRFVSTPVAVWSAGFLPQYDYATPVFHLDIYDALAKETRIAIKAARSFAKSTTVRNHILYTICEANSLREDPNINLAENITLCTNTGTLARYWLDLIRYELDNNKLILGKYGHLKGSKWNEDIITTSTGIEIRAVGRGYQQRGWRPDLFIGDDMDDDEEVRSDEQLQKSFDWWDKAVTNMLDRPDCQSIVLGTPIEEVCLLNYIADKPNWRTLEFPAYAGRIQEPGREIWPSKWPHERLQERRLEIGDRAFASEFLLEPMPSEAPLFERAWFREYDPQSPSFGRTLASGVHTIVVIDPAISMQDGADYTAITTMSATHAADPDIYLRKDGVIRGHFTPGRTVAEAYRLYRDFGAREIIVECNAYQDALRLAIQDFMEHQRVAITVTQVTAHHDKMIRAAAVQGTVQRGKVFYDPSDPLHKRLIDECVLFKPGKKNIKKDLMDTGVYGWTRIQEWAQAFKSSGAKRVLPPGARVSEYTGVIR